MKQEEIEQEIEQRKEIRFRMFSAEDEQLYEDFKKLCIVRGEREAAGVARVLRKELSESANYNLIYETEWVDQPTLIEKLAETGVKTNPQTLYNYRNAGHMDGLFGSDGAQGLLYNLLGVKLFFGSMQKHPRARKSVSAVETIK